MEWITLITALIGLVAAAFTGTGSVSDEQVEALNNIAPGFGTAMQTTTSAVNGLAPTYTEWAFDQGKLNLVGLGNPFGGVSGLAKNVSGFLANTNVWVLGGIGLAAYFLFFRDRNQGRMY